MEQTDSQPRQLASRAADLTSTPLLLVAPLVIFLRHQGYPLLATESLICIAALLGIGLVFSGLCALVGNYLRVPLFALLVTLFVDFQLDAESDHSVLAIVAGGSFVLGLVLRAQLSSLVSIVCATLIGTSIVFPVSGPPEGTFVRESDQPADSSLPPIVHLILDEQIGVAGVPGRFDRDGSMVADLRDSFLDRGFDVYGKAYALSLWTRTSLGTTVNFTIDRDEMKRFGASRKYVGPSAYFTLLAHRGYRVHVYQTDHLNFCEDDELNRVDAVESCFTSPVAHITSINDLPLTTVERAKLVAGVFSQLSFLVTKLWDRYQVSRTRSNGSKPSVPRWRSPPKLGPVGTMRVFDRLVDDLARIKPGNAYFAHLLMPHTPFAYDASCAIRPDPYSWAGKSRRQKEPEATIRARQELYNAQVRCTLKRVTEVLDAMRAAGRFVGTKIIVQGDHGSRLNYGVNLQQRLEGIVAQQSTLFAFHDAGAESPGTYFETRAPINLLLPEVLKAPGKRLADQHFVPMSDFESGRIIGRLNLKKKTAPATNQKGR